jgi:hypothetical protein
LRGNFRKQRSFILSFGRAVTRAIVVSTYKRLLATRHEQSFTTLDPVRQQRPMGPSSQNCSVYSHDLALSLIS